MSVDIYCYKLQISPDYNITGRPKPSDKKVVKTLEFLPQMKKQQSLLVAVVGFEPTTFQSPSEWLSLDRHIFTEKSLVNVYSHVHVYNLIHSRKSFLSSSSWCGLVVFSPVMCHLCTPALSMPSIPQHRLDVINSQCQPLLYLSVCHTHPFPTS